MPSGLCFLQKKLLFSVDTCFSVFLFQLILGIPEQALNILHMAIEPILAHGAVLDKGCAMFLVAKCQVASATSYTPQKKAEGRVKNNSIYTFSTFEWTANKYRYLGLNNVFQDNITWQDQGLGLD